MPTKSSDLFLNDFLAMMVELNASDLHIKSGAPIVFRIDGRIVKSPYIVENEKQARELIYSSLKETQIAKLEQELELDYAYELRGVCRFRANAFFQNGSVSASFRTIKLRIPTIEELNLPTICKEIATIPNGLILICGPTGCGKSTTLAAIIDYINHTRSSRIITIEDPIEYVYTDDLSMICQREVGKDTKQFSTALRETLRQDPDVILVGEMRDLETIALALTAAETGHLVFATLHTQSAAKNIDRIIDVFPPEQQQQIRLQVSQTLRAVFSQTLVPRSSGAGRVPAVEIMLVNHAIANLVREQKTFQIKTVIQTSTRQGMRTMDQALGELVARSEITLDEAGSRCENLEEVMEAIAKFKRGEMSQSRADFSKLAREAETGNSLTRARKG
ncbi:MAG: type IV pilus twitching motility protein PilT [bacterium]|jgi:twitching motility protein PilT